MLHFFKILLKITASVVCIAIVLWCGLAAYMYSHKQSVLKNIIAQLNSNINGKLTIQSMEPTLLRGFPGISVTLYNVTLEDSLYSQHKHRLLQAKNIYVAINILSVIGSEPRIKNITVANGKLDVFTDSTGYSNSDIFKNQNEEKKEKKSPRINNISFENVQFSFTNEAKFKDFDLHIDQLDGVVRYNSAGWTAKVKTRTFIQNFTFNTSKGSFLKNKLLKANLTIRYNKKNKVVDIPRQRIMLNKDKILFAAKFYTSMKPVHFEITVNADKIYFANAASLLSSNISSKLKIIDLKKPLQLSASINGRIQFRDTPLVKVFWNINDNSFITPVGEITNCSFKGNFTNEKISGKGHNDRNSMISLFALKGSWESIPFRVDQLSISDLIQPVLNGRFVSNFSLTKLNAIIGGSSFAFQNGTADLDLLYKGGISKTDTTKAYVYGSIKAKNAAATYLPRNLRFNNSSATVVFKGRDLYINNVRLAHEKSVLYMNGSMLNFLSLYYADPGKMLLDWNIKSDFVNLEYFTAFLSKRKNEMPSPGFQKKKGNTVSKISGQMDRVLKESSVRMKVQVGKLAYKSFEATGVNASVFLGSTNIVLDHIRINQSGGNISLKGNIDQRGATNNLKINADIQHVNVQQFFSSFQNFGQDAITDKNIRGYLFATVDISGSIRDNGKILPYSLNGVVDFDLRNGALVNFEPIQKIGKLIFRNRNISNITINKLENTLHIKGDKVIIAPMFIESSALNVQVEGVYAFKKGTDINIDVPLRNPKKDELILNDSSRQEKSMKGIVVHLKAVDGEDGNVKIKWIRKRDRKKK